MSALEEIMKTFSTHIGPIHVCPRYWLEMNVRYLIFETMHAIHDVPLTITPSYAISMLFGVILIVIFNNFIPPLYRSPSSNPVLSSLSLIKMMKLFNTPPSRSSSQLAALCLLSYRLLPNRLLRLPNHPLPFLLVLLSPLNRFLLPFRL